MTIRKHVLLALSSLALISVLLPGCGGKSSDETPAAAKDGAAASREGGDAGTSGATPGAAATPGGAPASTGTLANPQPPEGNGK